MLDLGVLGLATGLVAFIVGLVVGVGTALFWGSEFPILGIGFLIILSLEAKPSGTFFARDFRCSNLVTLVYDRPVGGSRFIVKVSGAENSRLEPYSNL